MKISHEEVKKIARLARLQLDEKDIKRHQGQLSDILTYVEQLKEVDVAGVEPTAQVTGQTDALADDVVAKSAIKDALGGVPLRDGDAIKVKAVFDE